MPICVTPEDAARNPTMGAEGDIAWARELVGDRSAPNDGPLAHVAHLGSTAVTPPHFHEADQFQVFYRGNGVVGRHEISDGAMIHYTDGYTPYGPIVPGDQGCSYFTLRPRFDTSHHHMPEMASLAKGRRGRQIVAQLTLDGRPENTVEPLFQRDDGVAAHRLSSAPGEPLPQVGSPGPRYLLVLTGGVVYDGRYCGPETLIWVGPDEPAVELAAGPKGAVLAVLCFAPARMKN